MTDLTPDALTRLAELAKAADCFADLFDADSAQWVSVEWLWAVRTKHVSGGQGVSFAGEAPDPATVLALVGEIERLRGPFPCCPHCAEDPVHDIPDEGHSLPCSICDDRAQSQIERLTRWKAEALPVLDDLQELGKVLGLRLGDRVTGPMAYLAASRLTDERDRLVTIVDRAIEQAVELGDDLDGLGRSLHTGTCLSEPGCALCRLLATLRGDDDE